MYTVARDLQSKTTANEMAAASFARHDAKHNQ
jgi:hypothetical protein